MLKAKTEMTLHGLPCLSAQARLLLHEDGTFSVECGHEVYAWLHRCHKDLQISLVQRCFTAEALITVRHQDPTGDDPGLLKG